MMSGCLPLSTSDPPMEGTFGNFSFEQDKEEKTGANRYKPGAMWCGCVDVGSTVSRAPMVRGQILTCVV